MIGRGALSNPWLHTPVLGSSEREGTVHLTVEERMEFVMTFLQRVSLEVPPPVALGKMKKVGGYLSKGFPGSAQLRVQNPWLSHNGGVI